MAGVSNGSSSFLFMGTTLTASASPWSDVRGLANEALVDDSTFVEETRTLSQIAVCEVDHVFFEAGFGKPRRGPSLESDRVSEELLDH